MSSREADLPAIADTGARTTVAGSKLLTALGLTEKDLFPVRQKLCGANDSKLQILGGLFLQIKLSENVDDEAETAETFCYIQRNNPDKI